MQHGREKKEIRRRRRSALKLGGGAAREGCGGRPAAASRRQSPPALPVLRQLDCWRRRLLHFVRTSARPCLPGGLVRWSPARCSPAADLRRADSAAIHQLWPLLLRFSALRRPDLHCVRKFRWLKVSDTVQISEFQFLPDCNCSFFFL